MAFNFLQSKLEKTVKKVNSKGLLSKENIEEILKEVRTNLLEADVNLKVVNDFIEKISQKALGQVVETDRTSSQTILKIINDELIKLFGEKTKSWNYETRSIVMMVGLQGSGKTTTSAKLANYLTNKEKKYKKPLLLALDVYRPAAYEQLEKLAKQQKFDFFGIKDSKNVEKILKKGLSFAEKNQNDLIIIDTAGRLQTDKELMDELKSVKKIAKPSQIIFIADGMSGQEILNVADSFNQNLKLTSTIITKLDSSAKGGASLSLVSNLNLPIQFIGTGEKISNIELFHPDRMVSRLLGLGDIKTLTEKALEVSDEKSNEKMMRKMMSGNFDLDDLLFTIKQTSKMGSVSSLMGMLPNSKITNQQIETVEGKLYSFEILINSMTKKEKINPRLLNFPSRKKRVLTGSGRTVQELNDLVRQYDKMKKQMKEMGKYIKSGKLPMGGRGMF